MRCRTLCVILATAVLSSVADGQSRYPNSVQLSGIYNSLSGSDYSGYNGGVGFELQFRHSVRSWSYGGGVQFTSHSLDASQGVNGSVKLLGVFFEPRYVFKTTGSLAPYLAGRVAVIRQNLETDEIIQGFGGLSASGTGTQANVGGGLLYAMSRRANLDLGATFGLVKFGTFSSNNANQQITQQESGSGTNLVLRAGVSVGLGK